MITENLKHLIVDRLVPLHPEKIILFGSYAYGTPDKDSDLDLCVVYKEVASRVKQSGKTRLQLANLHIPVDVLTPSVSDFDYYKTEINSIYYDIDKHGIILWEHK